MNIVVATGKIVNFQINGKVLKFTLAIEQQKPCFVPCVLLGADDELKKSFAHFKEKEQLVELQGRISSYTFHFNGKISRNIEVQTYAKGIKTL